jgi:hypothetical protein
VVQDEFKQGDRVEWNTPQDKTRGPPSRRSRSSCLSCRRLCRYSSSRTCCSSRLRLPLALLLLEGRLPLSLVRASLYAFLPLVSLAP